MNESFESADNDAELPPPPVEGLRSGLPWERIQPGMTLSSLVATVRMVLFEPGTAFSTMRLQGSMVAPLLFVVVLGTIGTFCGLLWQSWARAMLGSLGGGQFGALAAANSIGLMSFVLAPFVVLLVVVIAAGVHHLCLLMFGGAPRPPEVTLRVVCWAWGASYVWMAMPICGGLVATISAVIGTATGLARAHRVPAGRASAAVIVPYLVAFCCGAIVWFAFVASTVGSL